MRSVRPIVLALGVIACGGTKPDSAQPVVDSSSATAKDSGDRSTSPTDLSSCVGENVTCYRDTALVDSGPDYADAYPSATWVLFGLIGDSVEISTIPAMNVAVRVGAERSNGSGIHPRSFARRIARSGIIRVNVFPSSSADSIPYTLRVRRWDVPRSAGLRINGGAATLAVTAARAAQPLMLVPVSGTSHRGSLSDWTMYPGTYKIALVEDSLYEMCALPCQRPDTILLGVSRKISVSY
jgi:hypothetical protein